MTLVSEQPRILSEANAAHETVVQAIDLAKSIDGHSILRDVNFKLAAGEFAVLLGGNGAGKSTLLRILATLIPATAGRVELFGELANAMSVNLRRRIGMIAHQSMLYRDLSARENLEFFARLYDVQNPKARASQMLGMIGLSARSEDPVRNFSRGMLQRVAIARALLHNPEILLADEPFTGLDAPSIASVEELLGQLHAACKTIILVNHDIEQSLRLADRALVLRGGKVAIDRPACELRSREVLAEVQS